MFSKLFFVLTFVFATISAQAAVPSSSTNNVVCFGGFANSVKSDPSICVPSSDIKNWKFLTSAFGSGSTSAGNYYGFYDGASQYVVTAGKTLYVMGFYYLTNAAAGTQKGNFGTAAAAFSNNTASAAPPTGYAGYGAAQFDHFFVSNSGVNPLWMPYPFKFAAGTYPVFRSGSAEQFSIIMIGKEITNL